MLGGTRLQKDRRGASIPVGRAPLYSPPLHPQLFADLFDLSLQQALLCFQSLLLRLSETTVSSPVEPDEHMTKYDKFRCCCVVVCVSTLTCKHPVNLDHSGAVPAVVWGRGSVLRDGQRGPGPHQIVTGVMGEAAGLAQSTGGAHANEGQGRRKHTSEHVVTERV